MAMPAWHVVLAVSGRTHAAISAPDRQAALQAFRKADMIPLNEPWYLRRVDR